MGVYSNNNEACPALPAILELERSECIVLCAEPGMGKTTCLSCAVVEWLQRGDKARYIDFEGLSTANATTKLRKLSRTNFSITMQGPGQMATGRALIACDNIVADDESDVEKLVGVLRKYIEEGFSIAMAIKPEDEMIAEQLGSVRCFWSCDLRLPRPVDRDEALIYDEYANGIPALVDAISKVQVTDERKIGTDASYQEPYVSIVSSCVRKGMMREEKRIRLAMLLLGTGYKQDLIEVLGDLEDDLWMLLIRDSPFLGADAVSGAFSCVGANESDCLYLAYAPLNAMAAEWSWLVSNVARHLMRRGDYSRAAIIGSMCAHTEDRCALLLESGPQMIDAGEAAIVGDAAREAHDQGLTYVMGYRESTIVLAAVLDSFKNLLPAGDENNWGNTQREIYARMVSWCVGLHKGRGLLGEAPFDSKVWRGCEDAAMSSLMAHGKVMSGIASCELEKAYDYMLGMSERLEEGRVSSAVAQMDYLLCSFMNGIVPDSLDMETMEQHKLFLERSGHESMLVVYEAMLSACRLLAGRINHTDALESHIQRANRVGDSFVHGLLLVAASVSDLRIGALTRSHVRLKQALDVFVNLGLPALTSATRLIDMALRTELGERILKPEIQSCRGISEHLDQVATVVSAAVSTSEHKRRVGSGRWGSQKCPRDVLWLVNVLMNDCGDVSRRFRAVMPTTWRDSVLRATAEVDEFFDAVFGGDVQGGTKGGGSNLDVRSTREEPGSHPVHVSLLGRFEVSVGGTPVSLARLERRRSKALLALLASVPGHKAKRFVIMESVWPSHDYDGANKCLYSATSVIRKEIASLITAEEQVPLVITNKAEGTVSLDTAAFSIDVDEFEARARKLVDVEGEDRKVVVTCREIEDLYKGDLYISPTDGMGVVETRSRELRALFTDAMIAGAAAAENLGMKSLACRFARKAYDADGMREDAMRTLVSALCGAGRHAEAERAYEQFVGRVVDHTKRPPSRHLREVVEGMLHGNARKSDAKPRKKEAMGEQLSFALSEGANLGEMSKNG